MFCGQGQWTGISGKFRVIDRSRPRGPCSGIVHPRTVNYPVGYVFSDTHDRMWCPCLPPVAWLRDQRDRVRVWENSGGRPGEWDDRVPLNEGTV